ncbi:ParB N-terminal domain-containing protein [Microlunatus speluncae]|uniref:ParB N-terminal domain-containing protein n=1 Tax=Microlunatus speluncae TaxID=2594267 RepID=UPI0012665A8E|nr:ParB N-terminal domain-containing protein [Microlunatus speluncae]
MTGRDGHIELERALESIVVGKRHRIDLGDLDALAASIERDGLLQPPTVTPDGLLVCGARRIAAIRQLGWHTVNVWVRAGLSDRLGQLMAEQDDNNLHKPLTQREAAALYRELKQLLAEDAGRRQAATRFSSDHQPGTDGAATVASPSPTAGGAVRRQAAQMVTGRNSYTTMERISELEQLADDESQPDSVKERAREELQTIDSGGSITAAHQRTRAELVLAELEEIITHPATTEVDRERAQKEVDGIRGRSDRTNDLHRLAAEAVARVKASTGKRHTRRAPSTPPARVEVPAQYPVRAFLVTWTELTEWWTHYDAAELAAALTDEELNTFLATVEGTNTFAEHLRSIREQQAAVPTSRGHLRAL